MKRLTCLALPLLLAACSSKTPLNYHTLTSAAEPASQARAADFRFALQGVSVPPQVDQPQLVVRQGDGIALLENERWIAPLADEVRSALSADLSRDLGTLDLGDAPRGSGAPVLRIKVDLHRFDSQPGRGVQQDALWTLRLAEPGGERVLTCGSQISQPAGATYAEVVAAHRQALAALAKRIEPIALEFISNLYAECQGPPL